MRAARLLHMLLLLQNRGRMTAGHLADELEVNPRTILRDVDAMTEAGLPIVVYQGNRGGIELGFNYRTRLTGLDAEEAEAMAVILSHPVPQLAALGLAGAGDRARSKLIESFPDRVRGRVADARARITIEPTPEPTPDPRIAALAQAIRDHAIVVLRVNSAQPRRIHPGALRHVTHGWAVQDMRDESWIDSADWGPINISARRFTPDVAG